MARHRADKRRIKLDPLLLDEYYWGRLLSIQEIADELHVSYGTVQRSMKRYNIHARKNYEHKTMQKLSHEEYEKTIDLYKQGIPVKIIAKHMNISESGVYKRLRNAGVALRNYSERSAAGNKTRRGKISPR